MKKYVNLIGTIGSALGALSGLIELSIGKFILPWIGNKENPVVLGFLTLFLSVMALFAVRSYRKNDKPNNDQKFAIFIGVFLPAVVCFTTVGRLWYLPGSLLLVTSILMAYINWFRISTDDPASTSSTPDLGFRMMGGLGSGIILASIGLAFNNSQFGLIQSEIILNAEKFTVEIIPMDIVRLTNLSENIPTVVNFEVRLVMIIYLLLIIGSVLTFIACLTKSKLFTRIGSGITTIGYVLFPIWLPQILQGSEINAESIRFSIGSFGWGWYLSTLGLIFMITASLFRLGARFHIFHKS